MGILKDIVNKADELERLKQEAIKKLAEKFSEYQNKNIKYVSKKPRIYIMNFSDLQNNWNPTFYDFEYQLKVILYVFKHTRADNLINKWNNIKDKGIAEFLPSIVEEYNMENPFVEITEDLKENWYRCNYTVTKFHPDVIKFVDSLL